MAALDHWHPVFLSKKLKRKPVGVRLCGQDLVLFRTASGQVAALNDCCVHRRMRLSLGCVEGERLRCKYHGWTYDADGLGESPATPKMQAHTEAFETQERLGLIWVKPRHAEPAFPRFDVDGWYHLCSLHHHAPAPLETTLDNFCEIEHTPTVHAVFGYQLERMHEVQVRFETTPTSVRVINYGPPKPLGRIWTYLVGIGKDYQFNDDWTTYFSPVYSVYEHWWSCPKTGAEAWVRWRLYIFCTPIDDNNTDVFTLAFAKSQWPGPYGGMRLIKRFFARQLSREVWLDTQILAGLADKSPNMDGLKLSRFDRVLGLNRERIDGVYRGVPNRRVGEA